MDYMLDEPLRDSDWDDAPDDDRPIEVRAILVLRNDATTYLYAAFTFEIWPDGAITAIRPLGAYEDLSPAMPRDLELSAEALTALTLCVGDLSLDEQHELIDEQHS